MFRNPRQSKTALAELAAERRMIMPGVARRANGNSRASAEF